MSQRWSEYERVAFDQYETPAWVSRALVPHIPKRITSLWECACGSGKMSGALSAAGYDVAATDIQTGDDFLKVVACADQAIVTNPPYDHAQEFIEHALKILEPQRGFIAMLLRTDFDHAKGRKHLFSESQSFSKKIVLTKRIRWIEGSTGTPSYNHAWFCWDYCNLRPPVLCYDFQERT